MASIVRVCDQLPPVRTGCDIAQHKLLNKLAESLQKRFATAIPGLTLRYGSKQATGSSISATLTGVISSPNPQVAEEAAEKTRILMDEIRAPAEVISMLKD